MATKHEVLKLAEKGLSPVSIATRLGCRSEYVRATLRRNGLANDIITHRRKQIAKRIEAALAEIDALQAELSSLDN